MRFSASNFLKPRKQGVVNELGAKVLNELVVIDSNLIPIAKKQN